jgi:hypothetical protein
MERDALKMRGARPFVFTNLKTGQGLEAVVRFIEAEGLLLGQTQKSPEGHPAFGEGSRPLQGRGR